MDNQLVILLVAIIAFALGGLVFYLLAKRSATALRNAEISAHMQNTQRLEQQLQTANTEREQYRNQHSAAEVKLAEVLARLQLSESNHVEKLQSLEKAEARLLDVFQNTATRLLDERAEKFTEQSQKQIGGLLEPFKEQLLQFRSSVEQTNKEIFSLKQLNQQITQDTANLTRALKGDSRTQGAWGEMVLERILEASGLTAGRDFEVQTVLNDEDGGRPRPDVIIRLPENKDVILDAKVSLTAYERFSTTVDDNERSRALNEHIASLKRHIDGLSKRDYTSLPGLRSLDFVLMFVPVEAAFIDAVREDDGLYRYALEKNIVIVGPSTLLATLRTVAHLWKLEDRSRNADEIARQAGALYDNFVLLEQEFSAVGNSLEKALETHNNASKRIREGRGNLLGRVENLRKLGANTKRQLPLEKLDDE